MLNKTLIFTLFLICISRELMANQNFLPIPLINRDDKLLKITTKDFKIINTTPDLSANFLGEMRWERSKQNLLLPYIKIRLKTSNNNLSHFYYRYKDVTYLPQISGSDEFTDLDISVFDPVKVDVFRGGNKIGEIAVHSMGGRKKTNTVLIDYSCSGYNLQVSGLDEGFLSIGCEIVRENIQGVVIPTLNVNWISSEYKTLDLHHGPYVISFSDGRESRVLVTNELNEKKEIQFKVGFPKRLHRLKTAGGIGPYIYKSSKNDTEESADLLPSFMIYGNYYLNNIHSLKFFEALVIKESIFNHAGVYVGSDLGKFYDDRLVLSSLIGFQAITHQFDSDESSFTQIIFPQGLELAMHHPFGMENYKFTMGGFLSPQSSIIYQNFWARFGSKIFLEFNYINWEYGSRAATMYGFSVGFPLAQGF